MERTHKTGLNEQGAALITVLLVLALLTIVGISATSISTVEQQIASNDKQHKIVLFHTDAGLAAVAKIVNKAFLDREMPNASETDMAFYPDSNTVYDQIKGYGAYDAGSSDFRYTMGDTTIDVDIHLWGTGMGEGGGQSLEFITGGQDAATGGGGGATKYFRIAADGQDTHETRSSLSANYIKAGANNVGGL